MSRLPNSLESKLTCLDVIQRGILSFWIIISSSDCGPGAARFWQWIGHVEDVLRFVGVGLQDSEQLYQAKHSQFKASATVRSEIF